MRKLNITETQVGLWPGQDSPDGIKWSGDRRVVGVL